MTDLKELRALCDAATDGKWSPSRADMQSYDTDGNPFANIYADTKTINLGMHPSGLEEPKELPLPVVLAKCIEEHPDVNCKANARFIAATDPQTVRALIDEVEMLRLALAHHINADAYASLFPDDECDYKTLKKQETWNRLQARKFIDDDLAERCSQAHKEHYSHKWDADGERCVKCGDKDWFNNPICSTQALKGTDDD